jgi:hypothetical protein
LDISWPITETKTVIRAVPIQTEQIDADPIPEERQIAISASGMPLKEKTRLCPDKVYGVGPASRRQDEADVHVPVLIQKAAIPVKAEECPGNRNRNKPGLSKQ